jgi:methylenetetrahydrofolate dehydrogenase (NADP+)/methenyltetrahydrofolate cyclohydrolase
MTLIDGKAVATAIKQEIAQEVEQILHAGGKRPHLAAILVGHDGGSETYVHNKVLSCEQCGFTSTLIRYEDDVTEAELLAQVDKLNNDPDVDGFIVQLPLPKHISEQKIIEAIDYRKDVDGFHPLNVAGLWQKTPHMAPCTPKGIMKLLSAAGVDPKGKRAVVIGRSKIVGLPVAKMLLDANATVTLCHTRTVDLPSVTRGAEILVVAAGVPKMVTGDMVSDGVVVIDVGMDRDPETGKLCGDVDFDTVAPKASAITPVPGGVGPMTIACLIENTLECFLAHFDGLGNL